MTNKDYNKFIKGKLIYTREEIIARVPKKYYNEIEIFIK